MKNPNQYNIEPKRDRPVASARSVSAKELSRRNIKFARLKWGSLTQASIRALMELTQQYSLSVERGQLQIIDGRWYVTHSGLLRVAFSRRCAGIKTDLQQNLSDPRENRWIFRATIYKSVKSKGFVGYGDADPSNVSPFVRGSELRIAETRAVNRRLYGRLMGLVFVQSRNLDLLARQPKSQKRPRTIITMARTMGSPVYAISFVF